MVAVCLVKHGGQRQLAVTKHNIQGILAHTDAARSKDAQGSQLGFSRQHVPDFLHFRISALGTDFDKAVWVGGHFIVVHLLESFQHHAVLFLGSALAVDRTSDSTQHTVKAVVPIQQRIFVLLGHEITPIHNVTSGIEHRGQLVTAFPGQILAWSWLEHIVNL